jgi:hypothetical protein
VDEKLARDAAHAVLGSDMKSDLVTKGDLVEFKAEVRAELASMRTERAVRGRGGSR